MLIGKKVIHVSVTRNGPKSKQQQLGFYVNLYLLKQRAMKPKSTSLIAGLLLNYIVVFFSCEEAYLFCSTFSLFFFTNAHLGSPQNRVVVLGEAMFYGVGTRFYPSLPHDILWVSGIYTQHHTTHCGNQRLGLVGYCRGR